MRFRICLVLLVSAVPAFSQQTTATLVGTASDVSGAVLPDVSIRATNLATNVARDTKTDAGGITNFDCSAIKSVRFKETRSFEFRTEIFNLFNNFNPDPGSVDRNLNSTRVIQLGAELDF